MTSIRIGTRGSALALWQARAVSRELTARGASVELVILSTPGDRRPAASLDNGSGKGVFVKDIDEALMRGDIDIAVHSAKDMAAVPPEGLAIAAVLPRDDPRDVFVMPSAATIQPFSADSRIETGSPRGLHDGRGMRIGTSSPRRMAQLQGSMRHATFHEIRGNVDTRLRKLDSGEFDALVLAAAGLRRLGLAHRISEVIPLDRCVPAPGQGIIAVEVRADDKRTYALVAAMNHDHSRRALTAEQAVVTAIGGGCQLPLGVFAELREGQLTVRAAAASPSGAPCVHGEASGEAADAMNIGGRLAEDLIARGARQILES